MPTRSSNGKPTRQGRATQENKTGQSTAEQAQSDPGSVLAQTGDALWRDMTAVNEELLTFGQSRLQVNLEHNETLQQCRSLEQIYRVQSDFASSTARQYFDESGRLMGLMTKLMLDCWTPTRH